MVIVNRRLDCIDDRREGSQKTENEQYINIIDYYETKIKDQPKSDKAMRNFISFIS